MCVLADENGGLITLEPFQNAGEARDPLLEATGRLDGRLLARAVGRNGPLGESGSMEGLLSLYGRLTAEKGE